MNVYRKLREYRQRNADFPETDPFVQEISGYLFRSHDNAEKFTNADDMFFDALA